MKAKVVKACVFTKWSRIYAQSETTHRPLPHDGVEGFIIICPSDWTITARPPRPKASKRKGGKR